MSLSRSSASSVLPSAIAAVVLLGVGAAVANLGYSPAWWQLLVLVVCAGLAAAALIVPALRAQRQADATRAERDARVTSLAEGIDAALAKLHAATAEVQLLNEQNLRHQALSDELTAKLNAAADAALEKINTAARDSAEQSAQAAARSVQSAEQSVQTTAQTATQSATAAITQASEQAAARFTAETERVATHVRGQLQAESTRVADTVTERAAPVERLLAELPAKITALETLAAKIPADATDATKSVAEARAAALSAVEQAAATLDQRRVAAASELDSAAVAARAALTTAAEEQTARVQAAAADATESLKTLAQELHANLKTAAEQPVRTASKPRSAASSGTAQVELILEETVASAPVPTEPAKAEDVAPDQTVFTPETPAPVEPQPITVPVTTDVPAPDTEPVNPVEFAGERAYDDLASAMDDALSR